MKKGKFIKGELADGRICDNWLDHKIRLGYYESLPYGYKTIEGKSVEVLKRVAKQLGMTKVFVHIKAKKEEICVLV